ncbi:hypothetical protein [Lactococcus ileimucosae]|uniref:hypothetical protein n=1 Tax=Lactococcus ileimucosae TaxID=2941329 RepID=UPI003518C19C
MIDKIQQIINDGGYAIFHTVTGDKYTICKITETDDKNWIIGDSTDHTTQYLINLSNIISIEDI